MYKSRGWILAGMLCALASGCGDSDNDGDSGTTPPTGGDGGAEKTLCAKYGGAESIDSVIKEQVIGAIAADCRINTFFTSLPEERFTRVQDCLSLQAQELFSCPGVKYEGTEASNGLKCRTMQDAHEGLGISSGDFDALIEDVVAGLTEAGVSEDDIGVAAPALVGLKGDIVEKDGDDAPTMAGEECDTDEEG